MELEVEGQGAGDGAPGHMGPIARLDISVEVEADWTEVASRRAQIALAEARAVAGVGQQQLVKVHQVLHLAALAQHHLRAQRFRVCRWLGRPENVNFGSDATCWARVPRRLHTLDSAGACTPRF